MNRHNLYMFRCERKLTMQEMAKKTGVTRITYSNIESGKRSGTLKFWNNLQAAFDVPSEMMWELQKLDERV